MIIGPGHPVQQHADELNGYHVVPRQLLLAADAIELMGTSLSVLASDLDNTAMAGWEFGILGNEADVPNVYNYQLSSATDYIREFDKVLSDAAAILRQVAETYLTKDDEFYRQFGYIESERLPPAQLPL